MLYLLNLDKHICKQSRFAWGNSHQGDALGVQSFLQFYFQSYVYDPFRVRFSSILTPKNFIEDSRSTVNTFIAAHKGGRDC